MPFRIDVALFDDGIAIVAHEICDQFVNFDIFSRMRSAKFDPESILVLVFQVLCIRFVYWSRMCPNPVPSLNLLRRSR
jgi:hypothetical protein